MRITFTVGTLVAAIAALTNDCDLGACPNNRKSPILATSGWGLRNRITQDVATQRITRTGS
jgi:hypothetical protein